MLHAVLVYLHLIATCAAIGTIVATDLRLFAKITGYRVVLLPPARFEAVIITASLVVLYLTGAGLVAMGMAQRPDYLSNEKLQAKFVLVGLLTVNAVILHKYVFAILALSRPVSCWDSCYWSTVSASVSLSNSIWFFCAFLGIARVWNYAVSIWFVLGVALAAWSIVFVGVNIVLMLASRDAPKPQPDWVDSVKASLSDWVGLDKKAAENDPTIERRRVRRDVNVNTTGAPL